MTSAEHYEKVSEFELDGARYDQPPLAPGRRRLTYVLCTTPRSGSWLLCRQLINAGIGVPSEYLNEAHVVPLCARWGVDPRDTRAYLHALYARRTTPNGAWGTKLMWTQFAERRGTLKATLLGRSLLIHLVRGDVVAQAASMLASWVTGLWGFEATPTTAPRTDLAWEDPRQLALVEQAMVRENARWAEFFASRRLAPLVIRYEDLVADQAGTVVRVARALGLDEDGFRVPPSEPREDALPADIEARRRALIERVKRERAPSSNG